MTFDVRNHQWFVCLLGEVHNYIYILNVSTTQIWSKYFYIPYLQTQHSFFLILNAEGNFHTHIVQLISETLENEFYLTGTFIEHQSAAV